MVSDRARLSFLLAISAVLASCSTGSQANQSAAGERLFVQHCSACHATSGDTVIVGPSLSGIATRAETRVAGLNARAYIEQSILDPSAYMNEGYTDLMPKTFRQILSPEELSALIDYLLTLR